MATIITSFGKNITRWLATLALCVPVVLPALTIPAAAASGDRTLYLYYTHTRETAKITFKRNGRYDQKGLAELNQFLRDWRRNEPAKMDPALFDLVWEVYQQAGATKPINVVSAYRAPETNEMLRSKSSAVAKNSRHTMGMAMDFFIPGIPISKLRQIAMSKQVGGVGYYPTSGSPFVHLDTGNVRAWPRMTRAQLQKVFPDGKTLHVPTDGVPLSKSGYQFAKVEWQKCHSVPCNGRWSSTVRVANNDSSVTDDDGKPKATLLGWLFGDEADDGGEESEATVKVASAPTTRNVTSVSIVAPIPATRPASLNTPASVIVAELVAPVPATRSTHLPESAPLQVASLETEIPTPRALITRVESEQPNPALTAYAPVNGAKPAAELALQKLIERDGAEPSTIATTANTTPVRYEIAGEKIQTASIGGSGFDPLASLIESTWSSVSRNGATKKAPTEIAPVALTTRNTELLAPDFDHITEIFVDASSISSNRYGVFFDQDVADLSPEAELGPLTGHSRLSDESSWGLSTTRFIDRAPIFVANR